MMALIYYLLGWKRCSVPDSQKVEKKPALLGCPILAQPANASYGTPLIGATIPGL